MPRHNHRDPETDLAYALGDALRLLRVAARHTTQQSFAKAVRYSRAQVSKIETGADLPSDALYARWLEVCKATDEDRERLDSMLQRARRVRAATPAFAWPWLDAEQSAEFLRLWEPDLLPGLLQIEEYIRPQFERLQDGEAIAVKVTARLGRQAILGGPDPVHVTALIHESVLYRMVGSPEVMVKQIDHIVEMSDRRNIVVQVVKDTGYFPGLEYPFEIASGAGMPDTVVMAALQDHTTADREVVRDAAALFQEIHARALTADGSRATLMEAREHWNSKQVQ